MTQAEHEETIRKIRAETEEIKRQMMQFEFQHKKDIAEADRRFEANYDRTQKQIDHLIARSDQTQKQIDHLVKLIGLTYDELDEIDATLTETGIILTRPRKRARIK
jgi:proline dehydrogenase